MILTVAEYRLIFAALNGQADILEGVVEESSDAAGHESLLHEAGRMRDLAQKIIPELDLDERSGA